MLNLIRMILDHFSKEDKIFGGLAAVWGWITSFVLLDAMTTSEYIWGGVKSIVWAVLLLAVTLIFKTFYKVIEPKITTFFNSLFQKKLEEKDQKKRA